MKVFEIKIGKTYKKVTASSILVLNSWCEKNNISYWRMIGMQSRSEIEQNKRLDFIG